MKLSPNESITDCYRVFCRTAFGREDITSLNGSLLCVKRGDSLERRINEVKKDWWEFEEAFLERSFISNSETGQTRDLPKKSESQWQAELLAAFNGTNAEEELDRMEWNLMQQEPVMDEYGDWE